MNRLLKIALPIALLLFLASAFTLPIAAAWSIDAGWRTSSIDAMLDPPVLESPANGATDVPIEPVTFSWYYVTGATSYELQVSMVEDFSSIWDDPLTFFNTVDRFGYPAQTQFYWRVRALDVGAQSDWSEVWSFTTSVLPTPLLQSPSANATEVSINPLLQWFEDPAMHWNDVQVATSDNFSAASLIVDDEVTSDNNYQVTGLQQGTQYWWRVRGDDPFLGGPSLWAEGTFTTEGGLAPVILNWPTNGASNVSTNTTFHWSAQQAAVSYDLQVATSSSFSVSSRVIDLNTPNDSYAATLDEGQGYWWRVRGVNSAGVAGPWSQEWEFDTEGTPTPTPPPVLDLPSNGALEVSATPTFGWHDESVAPSVNNYELQIATDNVFNNIVYENDQLAGTSSLFTLPQSNALSFNITYYWRMRAHYNVDTSDWSVPHNFTTAQSLCWFLAGGYLRYDDGSVNIGGAANLSYRLSVSGRVASRGLTLTVDGWPDFVFDPGYVPMPLEEVVQFIEAHGHLPGIPSAAEVEARGLALGQMQSKLLQKVEELTLYLIDFARADGELAAMPKLEALAHYIEQQGHLPGVPPADVVRTQGVEIGPFLSVLGGKITGLLRPLRHLAERRGIAVEHPLPHPVVHQRTTPSAARPLARPARSSLMSVPSTSSCSNNANDYWMFGEPGSTGGALNSRPVSFGPPTSAAQGATLVVNGSMGVEEMVISNSAFTDEGVNTLQWSLNNGVMQTLGGQVAIDEVFVYGGGALLTVHGTVAAKELVISEVSWPDYVFEADYALRPLAEVAQDTEAYNTWPGLETDLDALGLGERTARLLEQIEQLMLYLLALEHP